MEQSNRIDGKAKNNTNTATSHYTPCLGRLGRDRVTSDTNKHLPTTLYTVTVAPLVDFSAPSQPVHQQNIRYP
jgi:hypothetical protein